MATPSATFTEMVSTTLRNIDRTPVDNVTEHNMLLRMMKEKGHIETVSGGTELQKPLMYAENGTYTRYTGYGQTDTSASDVLTSAKFDWKQISLNVTCSGLELLQNNSKEAFINLKDARIKVAFATAANQFSIDLYSDGSLDNQIGGLAHLIQNDGTGTVGGINSSTYTFWQNSYKEVAGGDVAVDGASSGTAITYANLKLAMNALWYDTHRGTDMPDILVASHDMYAIYEAGLQDNQRYMDAKSAKLGFDALQYKSSPIIYDSNSNFGTTDEKIYYLNTDYLYVTQHSKAKWTQDDERKPINQDAVIIPIHWAGNTCTTNRERQGVIIDVAA